MLFVSFGLLISAKTSEAYRDHRTIWWKARFASNNRNQPTMGVGRKTTLQLPTLHSRTKGLRQSCIDTCSYMWPSDRKWPFSWPSLHVLLSPCPRRSCLSAIVIKWQSRGNIPVGLIPMIMVYEAVLALRICQALSMPVKLVQVHISVRRDKTYSLNSSVKGWYVSSTSARAWAETHLIVQKNIIIMRPMIKPIFHLFHRFQKWPQVRIPR